MKFRPLRDWSDDALWVALGVGVTIVLVAVVVLVPW